MRIANFSAALLGLAGLAFAGPAFAGPATDRAMQRIQAIGAGDVAAITDRTRLLNVAEAIHHQLPAPL